MIARLLASWLDPELVAERGSSLSSTHAARAGQLTAEHTRRSLARALDRLLERAEHQRHTSLLAGIPPCRDQVRQAAPLIGAVAVRLRSSDALDPRGIARLKTLLGDRRGPCYASDRPDALANALREVSELLDVRE